MLRPAAPADTPALLALTAGTGFFKPHEVDTLAEVLADYHAGNRDAGHRCSLAVDAGWPVGFEYHAPAAMTDRTWYLYWIVVEAGGQGRGVGRRLLTHAEDDIRSAGGRLLLVETSTTDHYAPTRRFYVRCGYSLPAVIPDYYADGDGMAVFAKRLSGGHPS